jgi:predicted PurR-regulated permease PerM
MVTVGKLISFAILVLVTGAFGVLFFEVLLTLLLPLFLALVSVVMFRPVHTWSTRRLGGRNRVAAVLTTTIVLLVVVVPTTLVLLLAGNEATKLIRDLDEGEFRDKLLRAKTSLGLDYPHVVELRFAERSFDWLLADAREGAVAQGNHEALQRLHEELQRLQGTLNGDVPAPVPANAQLMLDALASARAERPGTLAYQQAIEVAARRFQEYRVEFLGGTAKASFKNIANPSSEDVRNWGSRFLAVTPNSITVWGGRAGLIAGRTVFGLIILVVTMYFLFADGPRILQQLMALSPLEDRYVEELLEEFVRVARAVVAGSVASAFAQGLLAGFGFYIAGLQSVFLLTAVTTVTAMIPFVGSAVVWLPASLWLIFIDNRLSAGLLLMIYGTGVISTIDNVIKPWVLYERSAMHPLAALIGVFGGIQAMGPPGVFVGPMVLAFLQTLLGLLHRETLTWGINSRKEQGQETPQTPEMGGEATSP